METKTLLADFWYFAGSRICMQKDLGINGNLFGGNMLAWMDESAAIFARQMTGEKYVVTLRFGEILFKHPVKEGDMVSFKCSVTKRGKTSISFKIQASTNENPVFETDCTFVAVDSSGNKREISRLGWNVHQ